jgi:hypothetical protein
MLGPQPMVVLSTNVAVREVLDKHSAVTNERGDHYVGHRILGGGEHMLLMVRAVYIEVTFYIKN